MAARRLLRLRRGPHTRRAEALSIVANDLGAGLAARRGQAITKQNNLKRAATVTAGATLPLEKTFTNRYQSPIIP
ncbi:MAG: hypothetical protein COB08_014595 [Rhodobacteraceae bacterium]|nr:hypothetical protein [Paracoccaceae bacterium]